MHAPRENACPAPHSINAYEVVLVPLMLWQAIRHDMSRDMGLKSPVKTGC
jgi:hypothetical protein